MRFDFTVLAAIVLFLIAGLGESPEAAGKMAQKGLFPSVPASVSF